MLASKEELLKQQPALLHEARYDFDSTSSDIYAFVKPLDEAGKNRVRNIRGFIPPMEELLKEYDPIQIDPGKSLSKIRIKLWGNRMKAVTVDSIVPRITKRLSPWNGSLVVAWPQGQEETVRLGFDLDKPGEAVTIDKRDVWREKRYIDAHTISLETGEPIVLIADAVTETCYCEWEIVLTTKSDQVEEEVVINNDGKPFRTTALAPPYGSEFEFNAWTKRYDELAPGESPRWAR
ncbi:hypothetical protein [Herbidospora mongoliensis]|uniref:hypothetical protein n=1 Tax=Herbidospora mongoliensis TaxID=688067 RepID=UPI0008376DBD|nr:hypothetical protein [Herbidospora mongoliensis]